MGASQRNKGKKGEREVANLLQPVVNSVYEEAGIDKLNTPLLQRNTIQSDRGGFDLVGIDWFAVEIKRAEQPSLNSWWAQCKEQAKNKPGTEPFLIHRTNNNPWRVRMFGFLQAGNKKVRCPVDISFQVFLAYFRCRLIEGLKNEQATQ